MRAFAAARAVSSAFASRARAWATTPLNRCAAARIGSRPCGNTEEHEDERDAECDRKSPQPRAPQGGAARFEETRRLVVRAFDRSREPLVSTTPRLRRGRTVDLAQEARASQPFRATPEPGPFPRRDREASRGGAGLRGFVEPRAKPRPYAPERLVRDLVGLPGDDEPPAHERLERLPRRAVAGEIFGRSPRPGLGGRDQGEEDPTRLCAFALAKRREHRVSMPGERCDRAAQPAQRPPRGSHGEPRRARPRALRARTRAAEAPRRASSLRPRANPPSPSSRSRSRACGLATRSPRAWHLRSWAARRTPRGRGPVRTSLAPRAGPGSRRAA